MIAIRRWHWPHSASVLLAVFCISNHLYSLAESLAESNTPTCSSVGDIEDLVNQLLHVSATNVSLQQQLLRQQHHTPVVLAVPPGTAGSTTVWQLASAALLALLTAAAIQVTGPTAALSSLTKQWRTVNVAHLRVQSAIGLPLPPASIG